MDFDDRRRKKWMAGRRERGLPLDGPFIGDAAYEGRFECLDLVNFLEQLVHEKRMTEQAYYAAREQLVGLDGLLSVI